MLNVFDKSQWTPPTPPKHGGGGFALHVSYNHCENCDFFSFAFGLPKLFFSFVVFFSLLFLLLFLFLPLPILLLAE